MGARAPPSLSVQCNKSGGYTGLQWAVIDLRILQVAAREGGSPPSESYPRPAAGRRAARVYSPPPRRASLRIGPLCGRVLAALLRKKSARLPLSPKPSPTEKKLLQNIHLIGLACGGVGEW